MKSDILRESGIVERIIYDLSGYSDVPNKGFLAGGAVANLLMSYLWEGNYPINDLDIFIESEQDLHRYTSTPLRSNELVVEGDGYMVTKLSYDHGSNYQILNVERDGLLNTIEITRIANRKKRNDYQYILNGFDFNCCQVGIDLSNNKIFYTEEFENFLNHRQLEVTAVYTPAHTAIRLFKKLDELNCYCDIEGSMEMLSQPLIMRNMIHLQRSHFAIYFSTKYKEMYLKYYGKIKEYFKMVKFFDHKKELWHKINNFESTIPNNHSLNWLDNTKSIPQEQLDKWAKYNDIMWTLEPKKYTEPNTIIEEILVGINYNPLTFMNAYRITSNKLTKKLREKAEKVVLDKFFLCKMVALINEKFYDCDFDISHVEYIESFVDRERWAMMFFVREGLNIQETYNFISDVKKIYNKEGEWVSELLIRYLQNRNKVMKPTYENMLEGVKKEQRKFAENLVTPLNIKGFDLPKGVSIKELTSELDLKWAGRRLNNCMNNPNQAYAEKIKTGNVKLFVIITENNMTGVEFRLVEDTVYRIVQILSYNNRVTSGYHNTVANIFLNYLNMKHLKEIYESRVNSFISIDFLNRGILINLKDETTNDNPTGQFNVLGDIIDIDRDIDIPIWVGNQTPHDNYEGMVDNIF
jgi:hypothetical protein